MGWFSSESQEKEDDLGKALKALPCYRVICLPLGITLLDLLFWIPQFFMFLFLGATKGFYLVWKIFNVNCEKMGENSRNAFRGADGCGACCPYINSYTGYFFLTLGGCILALPAFLIVYPIYGAFHALKITGKETYTESDMAEEARPDKGGFVANLVDRAGWTDSEKEKCAESIGEGYFGYIALILGDFLTLTGMAEGFKTFMEGYEFHSGILDSLASLLSSFSWLENLGVKDYAEVEIVPIKFIGDAMKKAISLQYDAYAIKKGFASFTEWTQKSSLKKYRGLVGDFYGIVGASLAAFIIVVVVLAIVF